MLGYFFTNRRFAKSFEPLDDGFLYRRTPRSKAIPITAAEKTEFIRNFRINYIKSHLILWAVFFASIIVLAGMFVAFNTSDLVMQIAVYLLLLGVVVGVFAIDRRLFDRPQRCLAGRTPVTEERTWGDIKIELMAKVSWTRLIVTGFVFSGLAWLTLPEPSAEPWALLAWTCFFGLIFGLWGRNLWLKFKLK